MALGISVFASTLASGAASSTGVDLGTGWQNINVQVPTMSTAAAITLFNSSDGGTNYYQVFIPNVNTSTVAAPAFTIASGVGANGGMVPLPLGGLNKIKFVTSDVVSGGVAFKIICSN